MHSLRANHTKHLKVIFCGHTWSGGFPLSVLVVPWCFKGFRPPKNTWPKQCGAKQNIYTLQTVIPRSQQYFAKKNIISTAISLERTDGNQGMKWPLSNSRRSSLQIIQMVLQSAMAVSFISRPHTCGNTCGSITTAPQELKTKAHLIEFTCCHSPWNTPTGYMYIIYHHISIPPNLPSVLVQFQTLQQCLSEVSQYKMLTIESQKWSKCAWHFAALMCSFLSNPLMAWS